MAEVADRSEMLDLGEDGDAGWLGEMRARNESRELELTTHLNSEDQHRHGFLTIPRPYIALFLAYYR